MRKHILAAAGLTVCLLATGCGSVRAGGPSTSAPAGPHLAAARFPTATAAGNRRLAQREARRLLSLAPLPGGATPLRAAPHSLPGPAMGTPSVGSLVDLVRSWRIPLPYRRAVAWLRRQRPRGLPADGAAGGSHPPVTGFGYRGPASSAWQSAELDLAVAPAGHRTSVLRADAVLVWLDPVPVRDSAPGRRMHLTVADGCPSSDAGYAGVTNRGANLNRRLLPAGAPVAGLECRYNGMNGRAWQLRRVTVLTAARARRVAASMARIPLSHVQGGVTVCPMDDESAEVIALAYPGRADVDLWVNLTGCGGIANGHISTG